MMKQALVGLLVCGQALPALAAGQVSSGGTLDVVAIHSALMPNGKVLVFGYKEAGHVWDEDTRWQLWDPATSAPSGPSSVMNGWNAFCAGHSFLGDGRLFTAGGFKAATDAQTSSADQIALTKGNANGSVAWTGSSSFGKMETLRWYPTVVTLANGDGLIIGGSAPQLADNWARLNDDYEYFSVDDEYLVDRNNSQREYPQDGDFQYPPDDPRQKIAGGSRMDGLYPLVHLLPGKPTNGDAQKGLLAVLGESFLRLYNPTTNQILNEKIDVGGFRTWWTQGSSVLLPIDVDLAGNPPAVLRMMVFGGGTTGQGACAAVPDCGDNAHTPALAHARVYRYTVDSETLELESSMLLNRPRVMGDSVLLPDGQIALIGGAAKGFANDNAERITMVEQIRPPTGDVAGSSTDLINLGVANRGYHATALLLPTGGVFVAGGTQGWNEGPLLESIDVEVLKPPYMLTGLRPVIKGAPNVLRPTWGLEVTADGRHPIEPVVVLIRHGSRTHSLDTDQRMLRLAATATTLANGDTRLVAKLPASSAVMPPGPYMMFVLSRRPRSEGSPTLIPSEAKLVMVKDEVGFCRSATDVGCPPDAPLSTTLVSSVRVTVKTGDDDLRGGPDVDDDNAWITFRRSNDTVIQGEFELNNGATWANGSVHAVTLNFAPSIALGDFHKLRIRTDFDGGCCGDNWNVDQLGVEFKDTAGNWKPLLATLKGHPLVRLTGEKKTYTKVLQ
jgi:Domain of unknown function (DUF1929)